MNSHFFNTYSHSINISRIVDSTGKLTEAAQPGVKSPAVEMQLNDLKVCIYSFRLILSIQQVL